MIKIIIPTHEKDIYKLSSCINSLVENMCIINGGGQQENRENIL